MKHNIVFDMGQVLIRWTPQLLLEPMNLPEDDRTLLCREVFGNTEWTKLDRGTISEEAAVRSVSGRVPEHLRENVRALVEDWWKSPLIPMPGMAELVRELKANGCGIYVLSNANLRLRTYFPRLPGAECFDGVFVSAEHKLLKPQHEIYEKFLETFSLLPDSCFFIDDNPANVEGAERAGIRGTVFHADTERLRRELRAAGIRCRAQ